LANNRKTSVTPAPADSSPPRPMGNKIRIRNQKSPTKNARGHKSGLTPSIGEFFGSAVVSTASVGVPPTESSVQNRPTIWMGSQAHRS
jgi:hypothetical protein